MIQPKLIDLPIVIGITGTENGLSVRQSCSVSLLLQFIRPRFLRHGDCFGVDYQVANMADSLGIPTVSHPPIINKLRASHKSTIVLPCKPYLVRDKDIATQVDLLIACPEEDHEILRSGTWSTIRYARKANVPRIILLP